MTIKCSTYFRSGKGWSILQTFQALDVQSQVRVRTKLQVVSISDLNLDVEVVVVITSRTLTEL